MKCAFCLVDKPEGAFRVGGGKSDTCSPCIPLEVAVRALATDKPVGWQDKRDEVLAVVGRRGGDR